MGDSNIEFDLKKEIEIGKFLDKYFYPKLNEIFDTCKIKNFIRVDNMSKQHRGVDLTLNFENGKQIDIDEKASATYFNKNIPTFSLEVFYYKNKKLKEGWLFGDKYDSTDTYLLIWGWNEQDKEIFAENITKLEICSVRKKALLNDIKRRYNIDKDNYFDICYKKMKNLENKEYDVKNKDYLNGKNGAYWRISNKVEEKLFLILYNKYMLKKICQGWFEVTKDDLKIIQSKIH